MKVKLLMCLGIVSFMSCEGDLDSIGNVHHLEQLKLSDETLSYFDVYDNVKSISLRNIKDRKASLGDSNRLSVVNKNKQQPDYWTFYPDGETIFSIVEKENTSILNNNHVIGRYEKAQMNFEDNKGNNLQLILDMTSHIKATDVGWNFKSEDFKIKYSSPCWTTYIKYRVIVGNGKIYDRRDRTVKEDSMIINGIEYKDVIHLDYELQEGDHYAIYFTKEKGIIMIEDLDHDETWVLENVEYQKQ